MTVMSANLSGSSEVTATGRQPKVAPMAEERTRCAGLVPVLIALRRFGCLVLFEFLDGPT